MEKIMMLIIRNCEDCGEFLVDLLKVLLPSLKKKKHDVSPSAFNLAKNVFEKCADDLKTYLPQAVRCLGNPVEKYDGIVASFCPDLAQWENMVARDIGGYSRHTEFSQSLYDGLFKLWEDDDATVDLRNDENKNTGANKETLVSESRGRSLKQMTQPLKVYKRQRKEESTSKQKDAEDIGVNVGPPIHDAYQDNKAVDLKNDEYVNEDRVTGKHHGESETIDSHQLTLKSKDAGSMRKRTWKPNFLRKPEEGYEHLWTFRNSTSSSGSHLRKERRKKAGRSLNSIISKLDSQSLSRHAGEQPDLQETISIKKNTENSLVPSASIPVTNKSRTASNNVKASKDGGRCNDTELVGSKIKVWWPVDEMFYEGKVTSFDRLRKLHQVDYDDGDSVTLDLTKESWQLLNDDNLSGHEHQTI